MSALYVARLVLLNGILHHLAQVSRNVADLSRALEQFNELTPIDHLFLCWEYLVDQVLQIGIFQSLASFVGHFVIFTNTQ
jgi:hypothetical protein